MQIAVIIKRGPIKSTCRACKQDRAQNIETNTWLSMRTTALELAQQPRNTSTIPRNQPRRQRQHLARAAQLRLAGTYGTHEQTTSKSISRFTGARTSRTNSPLTCYIYIYMYILYIYWSAGFALAGYVVPGCGQDGTWMFCKKYSTVVAAVVAHRSALVPT